MQAACQAAGPCKSRANGSLEQVACQARGRASRVPTTAKKKRTRHQAPQILSRRRAYLEQEDTNHEPTNRELD